MKISKNTYRRSLISYMDNSTSSVFCLQLLLFEEKEIASFSETDSLFIIFLKTAYGLLMPEQKRLLDYQMKKGRKGYTLYHIFAILMLKVFKRCNTVKAVIDAIKEHPRYMDIIGIDSIPSEATLSRKADELTKLIDIEKMHERLATSFYKDRIVCNLSIDSTIIKCYEKPEKKEKSTEKCKRGPKKSGSEEEKAYKEKKEAEEKLKKLKINGDPNEFLATIETRCSVTGKKNSKGNNEWSIGYKAHIAVDDSGIPVAFFVSGACVNDMLPAIPLLRKADQRCTYMYALMDAGYWSDEIKSATRNLGKVPVIDPKANCKGEKEEMEPAKKIRYKARTTVERTNSELKLCYLPDHLHSRGAKARFDISMGILLTTMKKMRIRMLLEKEKQSVA